MNSDFLASYEFHTSKIDDVMTHNVFVYLKHPVNAIFCPRDTKFCMATLTYNIKSL